MMKHNRIRNKEVALANCVNVSLDIETLGTAPGCKVLSIGACVLGHNPQFYRELGQGTLQQYGAVEADTLTWWHAQPGGKEFLDKCAVSMTDMSAALIGLEHYLESLTSNHHTQLRIWTQGQFDLPILEWHYKQEQVPVPWHYWEQVDLRSIRQMYPLVKPERAPNLVAHNALFDAVYQAQVIGEILAEHVAVDKAASEWRREGGD